MTKTKEVADGVIWSDKTGCYHQKQRPTWEVQQSEEGIVAEAEWEDN